jgi:hypothetical protein
MSEPIVKAMAPMSLDLRAGMHPHIGEINAEGGLHLAAYRLGTAVGRMQSASFAFSCAVG